MKRFDLISGWLLVAVAGVVAGYIAGRQNSLAAGMPVLVIGFMAYLALDWTRQVLIACLWPVQESEREEVSS